MLFISLLPFGMGMLFLGIHVALVVVFLLVGFDCGFIVNFEMFDVGLFNIGFVFSFDWVGLTFGSVVTMISGCMLFYSIFYMGLPVDSSFYYMVFLFVVSMILFIFGGNMILALVGWDGLGVVSLAMIMYYNNWESLGSGLLTYFVNRLGDGALLMFTGLMLDFGTFVCNWTVDYFGFYVCWVWFLVGCATKSAQYPFSSWLPAAMTAPTPVSALVHSSTLVTAGIYFLIKFSACLVVVGIFPLVWMVGLSTMVLGSLMAVCELDVSKVVAFSTLSQLGMMMFMVGLGEWEAGFFHMMVHAIFKSLMFAVCGVFMVSNWGGQDGRITSGLNSFLVMRVLMVSTLLNLMGIPFMMGYLSSGLILEELLLGIGSWLVSFSFYLTCLLTFVYGVRIFMFILMGMSASVVIVNFSLLWVLLCILLWAWLVSAGLLMEEVLISMVFFVSGVDGSVLDLLLIFMGLALSFMEMSGILSRLMHLLSEFFYIFFLIKLLGLSVVKIGSSALDSVDLALDWVEVSLGGLMLTSSTNFIMLYGYELVFTFLLFVSMLLVLLAWSLSSYE